MVKLSPRYFVLPILALVVIGSLPAPAGTGTGATQDRIECGPAIAAIKDPTLRATFDRFERTQSAAAAKVCAIYRNSLAAIMR